MLNIWILTCCTDFEDDSICKFKDNLKVKRDLMKRKKEIALCDNAIIYTKDGKGVDLSEKEMRQLIAHAKASNKSSDSAFYESDQNSTRVFLIDKCQPVKEPCKLNTIGWSKINFNARDYAIPDLIL